MKQKLKSTSEITKITHLLRKDKYKTGMITGCFDIFHIEHLQLFEFAQKHIDILIVAVENDKSITRSKGQKRPIFDEKTRASVLTCIEYVDYVFINPITYKFDKVEAPPAWEQTIQLVNPTHIITSYYGDSAGSRKRKKKICKTLGIPLLIDMRKRTSSSTEVLEKID